MKLDSRYADYFPEYYNYFGRVLILLKSMYGMTNCGKLFSDELTECLLEARFIQSQWQMSIYYKYIPDERTVFASSYVEYYVCWYTSEAIGKCFVDDLGGRFHVNFLGYTHLFTPISIYQRKNHSISVYQAIYATSIVAKYLDTFIVKTNKKFYETTFPSDMILTKSDASTIDEKV